MELASGAEDCGLGMVDEGELAPGVTGCCELGVVCATAQAVESSKIAVIKKVFLIVTSSWIFGLIGYGRETSEEAALNKVRDAQTARVCLVRKRMESCWI